MKAMNAETAWPRVAVVGAGAVGCFFGGMLARAGAKVTFIGREQHVAALKRDGLIIESAQFPAQVAVEASTLIDAAAGAGLVLLCVKTLDLEETARQLAPLLAQDAAVLCMQNGVEHGERFLAAAGRPAITAVVNVGAGMSGPGRVRHNGRGDLVIGAQPAAERVAALFTRAEVPCRISSNIAGDLWGKLIMNCAFNAQSALTRSNYGRIVAQPETRRILIETIAECVAVAAALNVQLPNANPVDAALALGNSMALQTSSTAQDIARGKLTEIDYLNGYVVRRGAETGVATPVNATLHALVKLLESSVRQPPSQP